MLNFTLYRREASACGEFQLHLVIPTVGHACAECQHANAPLVPGALTSVQTSAIVPTHESNPLHACICFGCNSADDGVR